VDDGQRLSFTAIAIGGSMSGRRKAAVGAALIEPGPIQAVASVMAV
jgi:hypothetical protein